MKRRYLPIYCCVLLLIISYGAIIHGAAFLVIPAIMPQHSDVIIDLGGDAGARAVKGAELFRGGYAQYVLLTGIEDGERIAIPYYLNWRAQILISMGVPKDSLIYDSVSRGSREEALNTKALMMKMGWKRVLVVSDPPHMRRLNLIWGKVFQGSDMSYCLVSGNPWWWNETGWWRNEVTAKNVVNEYIKLCYYWIVYSW